MFSTNSESSLTIAVGLWGNYSSLGFLMKAVHLSSPTSSQHIPQDGPQE